MVYKDFVFMLLLSDNIKNLAENLTKSFLFVNNI